MAGAAVAAGGAVCAAAELNARYFYESFDDIDALLIAVYDKVGADLAAALAAVRVPDGTDPVKTARIGMEALVGFIDEVNDDLKAKLKDGSEASERAKLLIEKTKSGVHDK